MTSGKACMTRRSACAIVLAAMSTLAGSGSRSAGGAAFIWDADNGMRDLTALLIDEYGINLGGSMLESANGISADGKVIWGEKYPPGADGVDFWKLTLDGDSAVYEPLAAFPKELPGNRFLDRSVVTAMSRDGSTFIGRMRDPDDPATFGIPDAVLWSEETGLLNITDLTGGVFERAFALSADGSIVAGRGRIAPSVSHALLWSEQTGVVDLGDLPGGLNLGEALAISNDGTVVVGKSSSSNSGTNPSRAEAFRWTQETGMVGLGDPDGSSIFNSRATVISGDGTLIGGVSVGASFYTESEGWVPFGFGADAISFDGTYMVGSGNFGRGGVEGFLWSEEQGFVLLGDLPGGIFSSRAFGVSDDGRIVVGITSVPEPSTLAVVAMTGVALACRRRVHVTGGSETRAMRRGEARA